MGTFRVTGVDDIGEIFPPNSKRNGGNFVTLCMQTEFQPKVPDQNVLMISKIFLHAENIFGRPSPVGRIPAKIPFSKISPPFVANEIKFHNAGENLLMMLKMNVVNEKIHFAHWVWNR